MLRPHRSLTLYYANHHWLQNYVHTITVFFGYGGLYVCRKDLQKKEEDCIHDFLCETSGFYPAKWKDNNRHAMNVSVTAYLQRTYRKLDCIYDFLCETSGFYSAKLKHKATNPKTDLFPVCSSGRELVAA